MQSTAIYTIYLTRPVLSFVATNIQLGLLLHAGMAMTALKLASAIIT
jgi:hypothetical protein